MPANRLALCSAIATLLLCTTRSTAQSQNQPLTVHVSDPSGAPVRGARLALSSRDGRLQITRAADGSGHAYFDALPGSYVLDVEAAGFARVTRSFTVAAEQVFVAVSLPLAGVTERVVVTASGRLQPAAEVSKAVTVVSGEEIESRNEFSVAEALRTVAGVTIQQLGGPGAFTSIKIRGLREQDTSVLVDGVRVRDAASPQGDATAFVGELYVANLDRIEVLRGSGSSLYGSHAVGGAVNLISRTDAGPPTGDVAAEAGGLGFSRARAHLGGGAWRDRVTYSLGAAHTRTVRGVDGDDEARNTTIGGRGDLRLSGAARASLRTHVSDSASAINESPAAIGPIPSVGFIRAVPLASGELQRYEAGTRIPDLKRGGATFIPSANDADNVRDSRFISTLARFEHRPSAGFGYTAALHHLTTDRIFVDGPLGVSSFEPASRNRSQFNGAVDTLAVRADREWSVRHGTTLGYEYERERYESRAEPANPLLTWQADLTQESHSLFVQQELRFDVLQVAASVRAQRFALDRVVFDPPDRTPFAAASLTAPPPALTADVAASRWMEDTGTKIRAHAGNAYRAPGLFERTGVSFGSRGYTVYGDPRLAPERSVSVDAGVDQTLLGGRARLSTTWFHTRLTSVIAFESLDRAADLFGRVSGYRTADGRTARGVELSTRVQPHATFQASLGYTFVDAAAPAGNRDGLPRAAATSAHQWSAWVTQRIRRVQLSFEVEAADEHYVTLFDPMTFGARAYQFEGLVKADLAASVTFSRARARARLFGTLDNMFDRSYFVQGFRTPGRMARGGLAVTF
jgi:vitamin B12 transporter